MRGTQPDANNMRGGGRGYPAWKEMMKPRQKDGRGASVIGKIEDLLRISIAKNGKNLGGRVQDLQRPPVVLHRLKFRRIDDVRERYPPTALS